MLEAGVRISGGGKRGVGEDTAGVRVASVYLQSGALLHQRSALSRFRAHQLTVGDHPREDALPLQQLPLVLRLEALGGDRHGERRGVAAREEVEDGEDERHAADDGERHCHGEGGRGEGRGAGSEVSLLHSQVAAAGVAERRCVRGEAMQGGSGAPPLLVAAAASPRNWSTYSWRGTT